MWQRYSFSAPTYTQAAAGCKRVADTVCNGSTVMACSRHAAVRHAMGHVSVRCYALRLANGIAAVCP